MGRDTEPSQDPTGSKNSGDPSIPSSKDAAASATKSPVMPSLSSKTSTESPSTMGPQCRSPNGQYQAKKLADPPRSTHQESVFEDSSEPFQTPNLEVAPAADVDSPSPSRENIHVRAENAGELLTIPPCMSEEEVGALLTATPSPPVTKESLEELDLIWIQSNINLRIDLNFDHDLQFTPISGEKGEQKRREAKQYWLSLEAELRIMYHHNILFSCTECERKRSFSPNEPVRFFAPRIRLLFLKLKELLLILVPDRDQYQIAQYLDVSLLLQEVSHGLLDVVRLARWLSGLLTSHCAPMRDVSANEMAEQVRQGAEKGDLHAVVAGIEKLFVLCEAMKLDVANHQVRSFRYLLIDDTVAFQQEFFQARMHHGHLEVKTSRQWYCDAFEKHQECRLVGQSPKSLPLDSLMHGLLELSLTDNADIPATLHYDHRRLKEMRIDVEDLIHLNISLGVFDRLVQKLRTERANVLRTHEIVGNRLAELHLVLQNRIMDLTDGTTDPTITMPEIWLQHAHVIAVELTRAAYSMTLRVGSIVQVPDTVIAWTTQTLTNEFENEAHTHRRATELTVVLEQSAHEHAEKFQPLTTLAISQAQKQWQQSRVQRQKWRVLPDVEDIGRRLAHIAVIHWRVWADLAYMEPEEQHEQGVEGPGISGAHEMIDNRADFVQLGTTLHDTRVQLG